MSTGNVKQSTSMHQGRDGFGESHVRPAAQGSRSSASYSLGHAHSPSLAGNQPFTPVPGVQPTHQPQYATPGPAQLRPVQFAPPNQASYMQNFGNAFSQPPGQTMQHQPNASVMTSYSSGPVGRGTFNQSTAHQSNMYNPPRPPEVYTLPDSVNEALDGSIRFQFRRDNSGRVLFFTAPPLERPSRRVASESAALEHSARYLSGRDEWRAEREKKRKQRTDTEIGRVTKRPTPVTISSDAFTNSVALQAAEALDEWFRKVGIDAGLRVRETNLMDERAD
jgi:chromatin structure-remodeling complex subunit RSC1/2